MSGDWADIAAANGRLLIQTLERLAAAERGLEVARVLLDGIQWSATHDYATDPVNACPACDREQERDGGHADNCELTALLACIDALRQRDAAGRGDP